MDNRFLSFHRSYRKIDIDRKNTLFQFLFLLFIFEVFVFFFASRITLLMCDITKKELSSVVSAEIKILEVNGIVKKMHILDTVGSYPSYYYSLFCGLLSILSIFLTRFINSKPLQLWINFIFVLLLVSSIFFIIFPFDFPYIIKDLSKLYMDLQIGIWIFIPIVFGFAIVLLPVKFFWKFFVLLFTLIYSIIFGTVRYLVFLYVLCKFSYIFAVILYFVFGPFMDYTYIVGFYSLFIGLISENLKNKKDIWKWVF